MAAAAPIPLVEVYALESDSGVGSLVVALAVTLEVLLACAILALS